MFSSNHLVLLYVIDVQIYLIPVTCDSFSLAAESKLYKIFGVTP